jgi:hypothetical protein
LHFIGAWVPLEYIVGTMRKLFNCVTILSNQLNDMIERVHKTMKNPRFVPSFYMALYLLDVICDTNIFIVLNFNYHVSEVVHVYFHIL